MSSANQRNDTLLHRVGSLGLLGALAAGLAWACVSSNSDGNVAGTAGNGSGAGPSQGGGTGTGGWSTADCNIPDASVKTGPACTTSGVLALNDSCSFGTWNMSDGTWSGGLACWSGLETSTTCSGGAMHVTGTYPGYAVAGTNGNAGCNTYFNVATDAGPGCSILDASAHKGISFDINVTQVPDNTLIVGFELANGNQIETTLTTLKAGANHVELAWSQLAPKNNCGLKDGSNITNMYLVFKWFADTGSYTVDATFTNFSFYD